MSRALWEGWQETLERCRDDLAIRGGTSGAIQRFHDLDVALAAISPLKPRKVHVVSVAEGVVNFVTQTLRAWRDDAVLCPMEREGASLPEISGLPENIVHLKLTSGSTGEPRCVMFSAEQLAADAENIRGTMKLDVEFPNLAIVSAAHSYGFSNLVLPLLLQGHPIVSVADALPGSLRSAFNLPHRFTLPAVPALWRSWWQAGLLENAPIALGISAGAPLPLEVEQGIFAENGIKVHNFYGSSECGGIAYDRSDTPREDASLAGGAMRGVNLSVNEDGCLVVEGQNVGAGHWPQSNPSLANGRFVTSDLVELQNGAVHMRGRVSDAINIAGRKLNPSDVEHALLSCAGVKHCVVFGVPSADPSRFEETVACVNADAGVAETDLLQAAGRRLATWQLPRRIWFCDELQPNSRGKISRAEWRALWLNHSRRIQASPGMRQGSNQ